MAFPKPFYSWRPHPWHGLEVGPSPPTPGLRLYRDHPIRPGEIRDRQSDRLSAGRSPPTHLVATANALRLHPAHLLRQAGRRPLSRASIGAMATPSISALSASARSRAQRSFSRPGSWVGCKPSMAAKPTTKSSRCWKTTISGGQVTDISGLPEILVERLRHYFSTYKLVPGKPSQFTIEKVYGCEYAFAVIAAAIEDYNEEYG